MKPVDFSEGHYCSNWRSIFTHNELHQATENTSSYQNQKYGQFISIAQDTRWENKDKITTTSDKRLVRRFYEHSP